MKRTEGGLPVSDVQVSNVVHRRTSSIQGRIDAPHGGIIPGWIASIETGVMPVVFVNGTPVKLLNWPVKRSDVNKTLGIPGDLGFELSADGLGNGDLIELFAFDGHSLWFLASRISEVTLPVSDVFQQIVRAKEISESSDSVAIACWEAGHNPIGRAHVLYNIIEAKRPAVIFAFLFPEFGGELWHPLAQSVFNRVLIPWEKRHLYFKIFRTIHLTFPTIWMCKPRLPTFDIAANIQNKNTKLILDHDDNEVYFAKSTPSDRTYGPNTTSLATYIQRSVRSHTAASPTLALEMNGKLIRHARQYPLTPSSLPTTRDSISIGFVGTVRPHKGLVEAARAIKLASWVLRQEFKFHVYGSFHPASLRKELDELGAVTGEIVPEGELQDTLTAFDFILTGFPTKDASHSNISEYQVSSKIGDALAAGRIALVPDGKSVSDLKEVPGIFLFESSGFFEALKKAMSFRGTIDLPVSFSLEASYKTFLEAEMIAGTPSAAFDILKNPDQESVDCAIPALVLIWKQSDSGIYGRRVDQIARGYKTRFPGQRVIVLELCSQDARDPHIKNGYAFSGDSRIIPSIIESGDIWKWKDRSGVEYHSLHFLKSSLLSEKFLAYLAAESISHKKTTFVVFPFIHLIGEVIEVLSNFECIIDIVDNQFSWASNGSELELGAQYASLLRMARYIIFNSETNMRFFEDRGLLAAVLDREQKVLVIPNWYCKPAAGNGSVADVDLFETSVSPVFNLIYSGNLNDRLDWDLLDAVASMPGDVVLHLAGVGSRVVERLDAITSRPNVIYWGPLTEEKIALLLSGCCAGLVPHLQDGVSSYMNPIKVHMYRAYGLPVVSMDVPSVMEEEGLTICSSRVEFLEALARLQAELLSSGSSRPLRATRVSEREPALERYLEILSTFSEKYESERK